MSSTHSAASVAFPSDLSEPECELSPSVSVSREGRSSSPDVGLESPSTLTSESSPASTQTLSAVDFPARILAAPDAGLVLTEAEAACGENSSGSSVNLDLPGLSWRTFTRDGESGCPSCGKPYTSSGTPACLYKCAPLTSACRIGALASSLLPTPTASTYSSNVGGAEGRVGKIRYSLDALARRGELPGHPQGSLSPEWTEQAMGYEIGWTEIADSETRSCPTAPSSSGEQL